MSLLYETSMMLKTYFFESWSKNDILQGFNFKYEPYLPGSLFSPRHLAGAGWLQPDILGCIQPSP
jgi:hypothetical protein